MLSRAPHHLYTFLRATAIVVAASLARIAPLPTILRVSGKGVCCLRSSRRRSTAGFIKGAVVGLHPTAGALQDTCYYAPLGVQADPPVPSLFLARVVVVERSGGRANSSPALGSKGCLIGA